MKIRTRHVLLSCIFVCGCAPAGSALRSSPVRQQVSATAPRQSPDSPALKRLANGHYRVRKPWTVILNGRAWQVPSGYKTNGITAPARFKKPLGDGVDHPETWAAIFHDWLFTQPGISRSQADSLFYDLLIAYGVPVAQAKLMYSSVALYSLTKSFR